MCVCVRACVCVCVCVRERERERERESTAQPALVVADVHVNLTLHKPHLGVQLMYIGVLGIAAHPAPSLANLAHTQSCTGGTTIHNCLPRNSTLQAIGAAGPPPSLALLTSGSGMT